MALASLAALKESISIAVSDTASDALLSRILASSSAWFITQCNGRVFGVANYNEYIEAGRAGVVVLPQYPIVSISLVETDAVILVATPGSDTGYWYDAPSGIVRSYEIARGDYVHVTWSAGYAQVPADVRAAVIDLAASEYKRMPRIGIASSSAVGETTTFSPWAASDFVRKTIEAYRRP
jgi:hypothetical protein